MTILLIIAAYVIIAGVWAAALIVINSKCGEVFDWDFSGYFPVVFIAMFWPIAAPVALMITVAVWYVKDREGCR